MEALECNLYTSNATREFEAMAIEHGISEDTMMANAGESAFNVLQTNWPNTKSIAVVCGKGNNGGDGYVVAKLAYCAGLRVTVWHVGDPEQLTGPAKKAYEKCHELGIVIKPWHVDVDFQCDVIVDALLGIGLNGPVREEYISVIDSINESNLPVLALDVPSGVNADTGLANGVAVKAAMTVTFIGLKRGLVTGNAKSLTGKIIVSDINLPKKFYEQHTPNAHQISYQQLKSFLQPRPKDVNKSHFGHVLMIGGNNAMMGAISLAGRAALKTGCGLVSIATRPEHANQVTVLQPELMCHGISTNQELDDLIKKATVVAIGPGLGQDEWAKELWQKVIESDLPLVVDADALNLLAQKSTMKKQNWILTPHPGEAARLLECDITAIQSNRFHSAEKLQQRYGGYVILKGAGSIIQHDKASYVCADGNPGMATAGMGDVLTGIIVSLIAQGFPLGIAANLGVCLHAAAGDCAALEGERGLVASDVIAVLRKLINP